MFSLSKNQHHLFLNNRTALVRLSLSQYRHLAVIYVNKRLWRVKIKIHNMQTFVRVVTFISCTFLAVLFCSFFFKNTSGKAKETGEVAKGFVRNTFRLFKREVVYYISERGGFGGGRQIFENVQNVRGLLNQIKIEANSRFLQQQTKKSRWCGSFWQQTGDLVLDLFNSVGSVLLTSAQHTPAITRFQYY